MSRLAMQSRLLVSDVFQLPALRMIEFKKVLVEYKM